MSYNQLDRLRPVPAEPVKSSLKTVVMPDGGAGTAASALIANIVDASTAKTAVPAASSAFLMGTPFVGGSESALSAIPPPPMARVNMDAHLLPVVTVAPEHRVLELGPRRRRDQVEAAGQRQPRDAQQGQIGQEAHPSGRPARRPPGDQRGQGEQHGEDGQGGGGGRGR